MRANERERERERERVTTRARRYFEERRGI